MKLFVGNLAWSLTEDDLRAAFEAFGAVDEAKIVLDRETNRSRGFGFVTMSDKAAAEAAMEELNGKPLNNRDLVVNEAKPRPQNDRPRSNRW